MKLLVGTIALGYNKSQHNFTLASLQQCHSGNANPLFFAVKHLEPAAPFSTTRVGAEALAIEQGQFEVRTQLLTVLTP